jgi:hypothetical protein
MENRSVRLSRILAAWALVALPAMAQRVPIALDDANFSADALLKGVVATAQVCARLAGAVWARAPAGDAECIRYWASGLGSAGANRRVMVYIPPDQLAFDHVDAAYTGHSPKSLQALALAMHQAAGVPFILLSRPGMLGSSGDHRQRRREPEARLLSAALDEIKAAHGIDEFALVGLSGGGHSVAALLGWRSDIVCAVAASAVSSPAMRWKLMGRAADLTGYADSYEPVGQLQPGNFHRELRVFVLGDPKDSNVAWQTQLPLAVRLQELGVRVELISGEGSDGQRHALGNSARRVGGLCAKGVPTERIREVAAQGLKG